MKLSSFPPSSGVAVQPNVRCLVGLYGSLKDSSLENLNRLVEEDRDEQEILRYAISHAESDEVRFLVGSQSLKLQDHFGNTRGVIRYRLEKTDFCTSEWRGYFIGYIGI